MATRAGRVIAGGPGNSLIPMMEAAAAGRDRPSDRSPGTPPIADLKGHQRRRDDPQSARWSFTISATILNQRTRGRSTRSRALILARGRIADPARSAGALLRQGGRQCRQNGDPGNDMPGLNAMPRVRSLRSSGRRTPGGSRGVNSLRGGLIPHNREDDEFSSASSFARPAGAATPMRAEAPDRRLRHRCRRPADLQGRRQDHALPPSP